MGIELQKAGLWKRMAAWLLDLILLCVLATGFGFGLSAIFDYDGYSETLNAACDRIGEQYGISFDMDQKTYDSMSQQEKDNYDKAYQELMKDGQASHAYNMIINLSLLIITLAILFSVLALEFAVPLLLGNGTTVGKKVFSLGVVRIDGVRVNAMQLFVRSLLGKYTIETMIPLYLFMMMFWGFMGAISTAVILGIGLVQVILYGVTRNHCVIHDLLAGTAVVDVSSQRVFSTTEDLIAYQKKIAAERAAKKPY